ncbi:MAG: hypothetical protein ABW321_02055 [Polyangiales bacterium]
MALTCWLALSSAGRAREPAITWQAPAGCPSAEAVSALLARSPHALDALLIRGTITRDGREHVLDLHVLGHGQRFSRSLRAVDCSVLAESAVWLVELAATELSPSPGTTPPSKREHAVAADSSPADGVSPPSASSVATGRSSNRSASPGPEAPIVYDTSLPAITDQPPSAAIASDPEAEAWAGRWHPRVGVGLGVVDLGLTGAATDLGLDAMAAHASWIAGLRLGALLHPTRTFGERAEVQLTTAYAQLSFCGHWRMGTPYLATGPCALVNTWLTFASPRGLEHPTSPTTFWLGAGGAWRVTLRLHRFCQLVGEVGLALAISARPAYDVSNNRVIQASPTAGHARLGYFLELW